MVGVMDTVLLVLWRFISLLITVSISLIRFLAAMLKVFPGIIFRLPFLRKIAEFAEDIIYSAPVTDLTEKIQDIYEKFSDRMEESPLFRRVAAIITALIIFFCIYPPSHWGPWYEYQRGTASYYSKGFWFRKTKSGERFIPLFYTAAHKQLPMGTTVKVVNQKNNKTVYVKINDRGPFVKGRIIDLSSAAAKKIGIYNNGTGDVIIYTRKKYPCK